MGKTSTVGRGPAVISLFSGAGGFDLGLECAGFSIRLALDNDRSACATLRHNRGGLWPVLESDIHDLSVDEICDQSKVEPGEPALLAGGPPCQPFSKAAFWRDGETRRLSDPRADTLSAYLATLKQLRPHAFLLENVSGLTFRGKDDGLRLLYRTIKAINRRVGTRYSFSVLKLNAADFGVPQLRERVFIVGFRNGHDFIQPSRTHFNPVELDRLSRSERREMMPWRTAWDAIGDLVEDETEDLTPGGFWAELLPSIPEGSNYLFHTCRGGGLSLFGWRRRYWSFLLKLAKNRPSWTIQAQPGPAIGPFHWKSRRLSSRELCRLQTFPDTYTILGNRADVQRQIGNAVPSLLGEVLGRSIWAQLFNDGVERTIPTLSVERRPGMPRPERYKMVPPKYHAQIGDHQPHPGTGKGFAAKANRRVRST